MPAQPLDLDGLLIIDKPAGWTSHDVVGRLRRLTGIRRIGHAGTLDPLATGVLPMGIGRGTRVLEYVSDAEKQYAGTLVLGAVTDTYDSDGRMLEQRDWSRVSEVMARRTFAEFLGTIEQHPPIYSAIKQGGVPLHRLARAGKAVAPPSRTVTIREVEVTEVDLPRVSFRVTCTKGTYIRSLAHDLGQRLGCGAHLIALRRTMTGGFTLCQAVTIENFERALNDGSWPARVLPVDQPLIDRPALILDERASERLQFGVAPDAPAPTTGEGTRARVYAFDGTFLGVICWRGTHERWRVEKILQGR
ncbi:MAG: tRNA pseudouridine(55) synthase TruB [Dehalococcoidia bacterium]